MIFANVRNDLSRRDAQLAVHLVGRESEEELHNAEKVLSEEGIDRILDDPRLLNGLLSSSSGAAASFQLFAYVVIRHALIDLGLRDRMLADYLASVFMHFSRDRRAWKVAEVDDLVYDDILDISRDLDTVDPRRSFLARTHLGNYSLWISGLYPDRIAYRREFKGGPNLDYYDSMGQKGFSLAAQHRLANEYGLVDLYYMAAQHFAELRIALNNVSDALLFPNQSSPDRLLRQVSNMVRVRSNR